MDEEYDEADEVQDGGFSASDITKLETNNNSSEDKALYGGGDLHIDANDNGNDSDGEPRVFSRIFIRRLTFLFGQIFRYHERSVRPTRAVKKYDDRV